MATRINTLIYPVRDLDRAKALFAALLRAEPQMDEPYYVGWNVEGQDVGLDPNGHAKGMTGPVAYIHVDDIETAAESVVERGGEVVQPINDVGGGRLIATVRDDDGNVFGLLQDAAAGDG
jgi:predicted enzyme related to lactoylglutathione lyase